MSCSSALHLARDRAAAGSPEGRARSADTAAVPPPPCVVQHATNRQARMARGITGPASWEWHLTQRVSCRFPPSWSRGRCSRGGSSGPSGSASRLCCRRARAEMDELGWDSCDVILVTGDAYVDHPSFGMALVGRLLEAQGFRVGHPGAAGLARRRGVPRARPPDRHVGRHRRQHGLDGQPLHVGSAAAPRRRLLARRGGRAAARPRADRLRAALPRGVRRRARRRRAASRPACAGSPTTTTGRTRCGGRSLIDSRADLLVYGNGERAVVEIAHRLAAGEALESITDLRGTAFCAPARRRAPTAGPRSTRRRSTRPGRPRRPSIRTRRSRRRRRTPPARRRVAARAGVRSARAACARAASARARWCACPTSTRSSPIRSCTPTRRASCTWRRIPGTRARWCSATAIATSG